MKLTVLTCTLVLMTTASAFADCYGWRRATDFGRNEAQWQCGQCMNRGHRPAANKMGKKFCVTETKQKGKIRYIAGNKVYDDFDYPANQYCGCSRFTN